MESEGATACNRPQHVACTKPYDLRHLDACLLSRPVALVCRQSRQNVTTVRPLRAVARLTSTRVEALKPATERYEVGDTEVRGLQLRIAPTGAKSWHWRYYWKGKQVRLVLGTWPNVTLAAAHEQAAAAPELLRKGIDPRRSGLTPRDARQG